MIDPKEVIARLSVEELCRTADEYYEQISDPLPLMAKPFAFSREAPEILYHLGVLLRGLHLGKSMRVLDFGAGTCWLSRFLAQMECRIVCCDASRAALEIGKRLFHDYPPIASRMFQPEFVPFDGRSIAIGDRSIDRVVCFDAFHHIPNQRDVIAEFSRVLRDGGIAGFSEPGRVHSRTPQSQYEMRNYKILENDILLDEIVETALASGFTDVSLRGGTDFDMSIDSYRLIQGQNGGPDGFPHLRDQLWNSFWNDMTNHVTFFLHKGPRVLDSRGHEGLAHGLSIPRTEFVVEHSTPLEIAVHLRNTGDAVWLHENAGEIFGVVRLGTHLTAPDGRMISADFSRHDLPRAVKPGESLDLVATVVLPLPGTYRLSFDLVAEGVAWFENLGAQAVQVTVAVR